MKPSTRRRGLRWAGVVSAATLVLSVSACGQIYPSQVPAQGPAGGIQPDVHKVVVGFAQQQLQAPYFAAMQVRAEQIAKEKGFKLLFQSANKDPAIQYNQMQAMMAQGANVMIMNATSVKGQKQMMLQIASAIPVIYIDTSVPGTGATSVQSDNLTIGRDSGEITAKRFLGMGKSNIKVVILTGPATDEFVGPARRQGFLDGLKQGGVTYDIQAEQTGDYAQDIGQVAAENMLAAHPDTDLVIGLNDSMTLGAYNVINGKDRYKNVYVAADQVRRLHRQVHLHRAELAVAGRGGGAADRARHRDRDQEAVGLPAAVLHQGGRDRVREHRPVLRPEQRLLSSPPRLLPATR